MDPEKGGRPDPSKITLTADALDYIMHSADGMNDNNSAGKKGDPEPEPGPSRASPTSPVPSINTEPAQNEATDPAKGHPTPTSTSHHSASSHTPLRAPSVPSTSTAAQFQNEEQKEHPFSTNPPPMTRPSEKADQDGKEEVIEDEEGKQLRKKRGKKIWSKLSRAFSYKAPKSDTSVGTSGSSIQTPSSSPSRSLNVTPTPSRKASPIKGATSDSDVEDDVPFNREVKALRFLIKLKAGETKTRERREEEEFVPENRRRFLFDDKILRFGASMSEVLRMAQKDDEPEEDINDIVDMDDESMEAYVSQSLVGRLIDSIHFRVFIMALIIINSLLIGIQTDEKLATDYSIAFNVFDQAVLAIFTCELLLKWYYGFWIFWRVGWNILDFIIVGALLLGPQLAFLSSSRILRILRVLRAFRSLRSVSALAGLSMVVQTILQSVPDMVNIVLLLFIILLVLAVLAVTLFGRSIPEHYGDLQTAMFSLFVCVTQDGWVDMYDEFVARGGSTHILGAAFLFISIMIGAFIFANLVVAVVVTNLEMAMRDFKTENAAHEDNLETNSQTQIFEPDKTISGESEFAQMKSFQDVKQWADFTKRKPLQKADLRGLTLTKMEHYCLVIAALEANLSEYLVLKKDLMHMYLLINDLNTVPMGDEKDDDEGRGGRGPGAGGSFSKMGFDKATFKKGDILSNLMRLEESHKIQSEDANTMSSVIRTAGRGYRTPSLSTLRVHKAGRRRSTGGQKGPLTDELNRRASMERIEDDEEEGRESRESTPRKRSFFGMLEDGTKKGRSLFRMLSKDEKDGDDVSRKRRGSNSYELPGDEKEKEKEKEEKEGRESPRKRSFFRSVTLDEGGAKRSFFKLMRSNSEIEKKSKDKDDEDPKKQKRHSLGN